MMSKLYVPENYFKEQRQGKMKILVIGEIADEGLQELHEHFEVSHYNSPTENGSEIDALLPEADGIFLFFYGADKAFIDKAVKAQIIATNSAGYNKIDIAYAREKGIAVCNSPEAVKQPTAELALAFMLNYSRKLDFYNGDLRRNGWTGLRTAEEGGFSLCDSVIGIVGMGSIGTMVAQMAGAFGARILYNKRTRLSSEEEQSLNVEYRSMDELLAESDFVTLHTPLTQDTTHLIADSEFRKMKDTACLVNTSRGAVVDEKALITALSDGQIAGACLDVFEHEPHVPDDLKKLPNVLMTPHVGTATYRTRVRMAQETSRNLISFLIRKEPMNIVN